MSPNTPHIITLDGDANSEYYVVCSLRDKNQFILEFKSHGKLVRHEFTLRHPDRFDELVSRFSHAFNEANASSLGDAGGFGECSFNVIDCFIDSLIDRFYDQYCAYDIMRW